jgi:DNA transposition AAA+ family ATPase
LDVKPPSHMTVYRILQPIIDRQEKAKSIRSPGWQGERLSVKTRDGLDLTIEHSNQVWQCDHTGVGYLSDETSQTTDSAGKPPTVPVIYIQIPQECGAKELFGLILGHLKYQVTKGTIAEMRDRTLKVMKGCQVEMLIIDEADRFKPKTFAEVRDIFDNLQISVILVGTDRLDAVIKRDEQVYNRFRACYRFGKLSGEDFERTVKIWEQQVLRLPTPSNLTGKTMIKTLGEATGGYIGLMDMILREAAIPWRSLSE